MLVLLTPAGLVFLLILCIHRSSQAEMMLFGISNWIVGIEVLAVLLALHVAGIRAIGDGQTRSDEHKSRNCVVPALFIFGDSTADSGTNNNLNTIARSNFPPYGRNFDTRHATGRFSNGRMVADFIAEFLRVPLVPPYLSPEAYVNIYQGVNFASAGAGILNRTGDVLGVKISQWQQLEQFLEWRNLLVQEMGEESAAQHLRHSVYYFSTTGNDFIHNYITNDTDDALLSPDDFNSLLLSTLKLQLQSLFGAGARKIVMLGNGPVGCAPHFLFTSNSSSGECLENINQLIATYNARLAVAVYEFNEENHGAHVIYRDIYTIVNELSKNPLPYGFTVGNTACCGVGEYGGGDRCLTPAMVCNTPDNFVWWDEYHTSHNANHFIASQIWDGTDPPLNASSVSPNDFKASAGDMISFINIQELALLNLD